MQKRIQIIAAKLANKEWDGRKYKTWECECILHGFDENQLPTVEVGVLTFPEAFGEVSTGDFIATFDVVVNRKDRKLMPKIVSLESFNSRGVPPVTTNHSAATAGKGNSNKELQNA
jgi:hypothetical protein